MPKYAPAIFIALVLFALVPFVAWRMQPSPSSPERTAAIPAAPAFALTETRVANGGTFELRAAELLTVVDGRENRMLAYNGSIPGPVLRVRQGDEITVAFRNDLAEPTTVHWHGLRVTNDNDGVPDVTQEPVPPGGTFAYALRFPDPGAYWYHPHVREDKQQDMGLYGTIVVEPADPAYWPAADREEHLVLDDILSQKGFLAPHFDDAIDYALMGRYGNVMLVNGGPRAAFAAKKGETVRFYVTNVANARPFRVSFGGAPMTLVGTDGGRAESAAEVPEVTLAPSERAIIDVTFPEEREYAIEHRTPRRVYPLGRVSVSGSVDARAAEAADAVADFDAIRAHLDRAPDAAWDLGVTTSHMMAHHADSEAIEWEDDMGMMNAHMTEKSTRWHITDKATGLRNMDIGTSWMSGEYRKIRISNSEEGAHPMQHPMHLHGQRFVVAAIDGQPNETLEWKDTVLVPKGTTVDIVVEVTNPGKWMMHCHIAEHLGAGMMTEVMVHGEDLVR